MGAITRLSTVLSSVTVDSTLADCKAIPFAGASCGRIHVPTGSSITSLTFYDSPTESGTFIASYDDTATTPVAIALTGLSAAKSYPIPAKMFGAAYIKLVGNADGVVDIVIKG